MLGLLLILRRSGWAIWAVVVFSFLGCVRAGAVGDESEWRLRRFVPPKGTNFEEVRDIVLTQDGSIWFASWGNGVARLSESYWESYSAEGGHLPSDFVASLAWDAGENTLWVGTDEGMAAIVNGEAVPVTLPAEMDEKAFEVSFVQRFDSGELWLGSRYGEVMSFMPVFRGASIALTDGRVVLPSENDDGYVVRGIIEDRNGARWVARNRAGIQRWQDEEWATFSCETIGLNRCDLLFEARDGTIWTAGSDVPCGFNGQEWRPLESGVNSKFLAETPEGERFVSALDGLVYSGWSRPSLIQAHDDIRSTRVRALAVCHETLLWIGTKEGILLGTRPRWRDRGYLLDDSLRPLHSINLGSSFFTSPSRWPVAVRRDGTVVRYHPQHEIWENVVRLPRGPGLPSGIVEPNGEQCWVRYGTDLFAVNLEQGRIIREVALPENFILTEFVSPNESSVVIVGESGGYRLAGDAWEPLFGDAIIHSIAIANDGDYLVALSTDIQEWRSDRLIKTWEGRNRSINHPFTFVEESTGWGILAGTRGLGLKVFNDLGEHTVSVRDHLLSSRILSCHEATDGSLWLGFDNLGVAVKRGERWVNYSALDGLDTGEVDFIGQDPSGDIWLAKGTNRFLRFEPDEGAPDTRISNAADAIVAGSFGIVGFEGYDAWGHTPENELEFSWRLVALEGDENGGAPWSPYTRATTISLPDTLTGGRYRLEARCQDRDFNTDPSPAVHEFEVRPPIWATPTFVVPVAILTLVALGLAFRLHAKHSELKRHFADLDGMVNRRTEELKLAYERAEEERGRLVVTLRSIGDGIVVTDDEEKVVVVNPAAEKLLHTSESFVLGQAFDEVVHLYSRRSGDRVASPLRGVISRQEVMANTEDVSLGKEGDEALDVSYSCAPILDSEAQVLGSIFAFRDISHVRRLEEEAVKASKLDSLGLLAGGIAHDFNNFLTTILGNISVAKFHAEASSDLREILDESEAAARRATDLTKQLLTFSKGGAPTKKMASITEAIRHSVEFSLRGSRIRPEFMVPEKLWAIAVDLGQFSQVIQNLTINALHAMPSGGRLNVKAANSVKTISGRERFYVEIEIVDTGEGISDEDVGRVFDPYFSRKEGGSGLGLSVCYSIMKRHDGDIAIRSERGRGTTVTLAFPARREVSLSSKPKEPRQEPFFDAGITLNVLVMDDEKGIRELLERMLTRLGHRCHLTTDGAAAVEAFLKARRDGDSFDILVLDLTVPGGMGGCEALEQIRAVDRNVLGIASSGYSSDPVLARFNEYGFAATLSKPYGFEDLKSVLSELLRKQGEDGKSDVPR